MHWRFVDSELSCEILNLHLVIHNSRAPWPYFDHFQVLLQDLHWLCNHCDGVVCDDNRKNPRLLEMFVLFLLDFFLQRRAFLYKSHLLIDRLFLRNLNNKNLSGTIPDEIGQVNYSRRYSATCNSVIIWISQFVHNQFSRIQLADLRVLNLCNNNLHGKLPKTLPSLSQLRVRTDFWIYELSSPATCHRTPLSTRCCMWVSTLSKEI